MVCLFLLSPGRVGPGINIPRVIVARVKSVLHDLRLDDVLQYQLRPLAVGKNTNSRFLRFFVRSVPLFHSLMLTPMLFSSNFGVQTIYFKEHILMNAM